MDGQHGCWKGDSSLRQAPQLLLQHVSSGLPRPTSQPLAKSDTQSVSQTFSHSSSQRGTQSDRQSDSQSDRQSDQEVDIIFLTNLLF